MNDVISTTPAIDSNKRRAFIILGVHGLLYLPLLWAIIRAFATVIYSSNARGTIYDLSPLVVGLASAADYLVWLLLLIYLEIVLAWLLLNRLLRWAKPKHQTAITLLLSILAPAMTIGLFLALVLNTTGARDTQFIQSAPKRNATIPVLKWAPGVIVTHRSITGRYGTPDLYFIDDETKIRTFGPDSAVCVWDAATLKALGRVQLPQGYSILSVREPDGKYAFCYHESSMGDGTSQYSTHCIPVIIVDTDSGGILCQLDMTMGRQNANRVLWANDREAFFINYDDSAPICRFDYRDGRIITNMVVALSNTWHGSYAISEDGRTIYSLRYDKGGARDEVASIDIKTCAISIKENNTIYRYERIEYGIWGLVPGSKYFYIRDLDALCLFDRISLQIDGIRRWKANIKHIAFNANGTRYAISLSGGAAVFIDRPPYYVLVHDTHSGRMLYAFRREGLDKGLKLSPSGKQLAIITASGGIELFRLE